MAAKEIEVWVAIDADGNYDAGAERESAVYRHEEEFGGEMVQVICLKVSVPLPNGPKDIVIPVSIKENPS